MSRCQYTVGNGGMERGDCRRNLDIPREGFLGCLQNMRQTVTGLWSAIIGRT